MKLSVIFSNYNRAGLMDRSLFTYLDQSMPKDDFEIIVVDDQSTDNSEEVIKKYSGKLNIVFARISGEKKKFRAQSMGWNIGLSLAIGQAALFTHPEIMMPPDCLKMMSDPHRDFKAPTFLTMKPYVLSQACQKKIDTVDWKKDISLIKTIPEFGDSWKDGNTIYSNKYMEGLKKWESNTTFSMKRLDLLGMGGFDEFDRWGPDDPSLRDRRKKLGIPTVVAAELNYHQNHDEASAQTRKQDFRCKWYPFPSSAKLRFRDHFGEFQISSAYRVI